MKNSSGQVLLGVIAILLVMAILVPTMVLYTQNESRWTAKQAQTTAAFQLAEAGGEKAYLAISISTIVWNNLMRNAVAPAGYKFDQSYSDIPGGTYAVSITSGPGVQQATVISVGRDTQKHQTRAIKVIWTNASLGDIAVLGVNGVDVSGNNLTVEWGGIVSNSDITANGGNHPSYWTSGKVSLDAGYPNPPHCDANCWWWHDKYNLPPDPVPDFSTYRSSAQITPNGPCGVYYSATTLNLTGCNDTTGNTYFAESDITFSGHIIGNVLTMGNFSTPNGNLGGAAETVNIPNDAWKQYCNDWSYYMTNYNTDAALTASNPTVCPGLTSSYRSPATMTYAIGSLDIHGLLYVQGNFIGPNGGGNTDFIYGVIFVKGNVSLNSNSHVKVYYDAIAAQNLITTTLQLSRTWWADAPTYAWPSGL